MAKAIQIPKYSVLRHKDFFRDGFISMTVIGKSGCGKTVFLANVLPYMSENIKTVVIASAIEGVGVHRAMRDHFNRPKEGRLCSIHYDPLALREYIRTLNSNGIVSLHDQGMLIFDDFNRGKATGPYWEFVIDAFTKFRNLGWNMIILAQQPSFIPTIVRNNTTIRVLFDCVTKSAVQCFTKDMTDRVADIGVLNELVRYVRSIPYSFMVVKEGPFEVCAGKIGHVQPVMTDTKVYMPTLMQIRQALGASSMADARQKARIAQLRAGNTSTEVYDENSNDDK